MQRMMDDEGRVPLARQTAVSMPMSPKIIRIFRTLRTPDHNMRATSRGACPCRRAYPAKQASPSRSAHKTLAPVRTHTARPPRKTLRTMAFTSGSLASVWMRRT